MRRSNGVTRRAALIAIALLLAAAGWGFLHRVVFKERSDSSTRQEEVAGRSSLPTSHAEPTASAGPSDPVSAHTDALEASLLSPGTVEEPAPRAVYTSRFAGTPGYYPPDDPESLSVVTGRREAPEVDLELTGGAGSLEELGRALVAALVAKDERAFDDLRVTKHEFRVICWPEFPQSRPITNVTLDDVWMMAAAKSHAGSTRAVGTYGGRDFELADVQAAPPFAYRNFTRYSHVVLVARDRSSREVVQLTFAPSIIERHGRFKVLIYRDR